MKKALGGLLGLLASLAAFLPLFAFLSTLPAAFLFPATLQKSPRSAWRFRISDNSRHHPKIRQNKSGNGKKDRKQEQSAREKGLTWCRPCSTPRPSICLLSWLSCKGTRSIQWETRRNGMQKVRIDHLCYLRVRVVKGESAEIVQWYSRFGRNGNFWSIGVDYKGCIRRDSQKISWSIRCIRWRINWSFN